MQLPLVFLDGPWKLAMGLNALDPADWLWRDERFVAETAERAALLAERPGEVLAVLPRAGPAVAELVAAVRAHLGLPSAGTASLADLARLAQEDFCVLERQLDGRYALTAALLCFPAHWRLADKLGRPLAEIHAPVPGFGERLGGPVDRFFANLAVERPVWRANWSVVEGPTLFHTQPREPLPGLTAANAGEMLWLRVERQTLHRLPGTGAVVFTIRTLVRRLAEAAGDPAVARAMAARIREMEPGMAGYKGMPALGGPLLGWLDAAAAG
jgi:dimethylamine monooxygenase subunit A